MTSETEPGLGQDRRVLDERYELVERIGVGGMAEVWRACDVRLQRDVAVKLLSASASQDESRRRKIEREARALAASNHPNVVSVYDYGEATGTDGEVVPYLVMELVDGPDLHRYLSDRGPLPVEEAVGLIGGVLAGIAHAHEAGVVHGDLKPANVFMGPHGPKVGDFGVARILDEETGTTTVAATPTFAAPEVLKGERATASADVYSAACIAFQLLTARPPFEGANAWDVASKHMEAPIPKLGKIRSDVPAPTEAAIARGMHKDPRRRHADPTAFAAALGAGDLNPSSPTAAAATVPVAAPAAGEPEATTALTQPRGVVVGRGERIRRLVRSSPNGRILLLLLIPLLLLVAFLAMRSPDPAAALVPDLIGERYLDAAAELDERGLVADVSFRPITEGEPGRVLETIPAADEPVADGGQVHIIAGAMAQTPEPTVAPVTGGGGGGGDDDDGPKERRRGRGSRDRGDD